jgi:hypothetical protein
MLKEQEPMPRRNGPLSPSDRCPRLAGALLAALTLLCGAVSACGSPFSPAPPGDNIIPAPSEDADTDATSSDGGTPDAAADHSTAPADASLVGESATEATAPIDAGEHDATNPEDAAEDAPEDAPAAETGCPSTTLTCDAGCVANDLHNCGACGHDCSSLAHVTPGATSCVASGMCSFAAAACVSGWADCNGDPNDGCETNLSQTTHCGGCTTICPVSAPHCTASGGAYGCASGCGGSTPTYCPATQTCVDTTKDPKNCKTCGNDCSQTETIPPGGEAVCVNSTCGWVCQGGYTQCGQTCVPTPVGTFASPNGSGTSCTMGSPCSLAQALGAAAVGTTVYLAQGAYSVASLALPAAVSLQGGWTNSGGTWCPGGSATIATSTAAQVIAVSSGSETISNVAIQNNTPATTGQTLYGVVVTGASTSLTMSGVSIAVAGGGNGASQGAGAANTMPVPPAGSCGSGGTGQQGSPGNGAPTPGSWSTSGYAPANGAVGGAGGVGQNRTNNSGTCENKTAYGMVDHPSQCGTICACPCSYCDTLTAMVCPTAGAGGCGGGGGGGGAGGLGGGSSVGVFVADAHVTISGSVTAGAGGAGGNGGNLTSPVQGQNGSVGATGQAGTYHSLCQENPNDGTCWKCQTSTAGIPGTGQQGGQGGPGGVGGGGAGGDSYCYVHVGSAAVSASGLSCSHATTPAPGGNQSAANNGAAGNTGTSN